MCPLGKNDTFKLITLASAHGQAPLAIVTAEITPLAGTSELARMRENLKKYCL